MPVGEVFLSLFLQLLFDRLAPRVLSFFPFPAKVRAELRKWRTMIEEVLADAEEKQLTDKLVKMWLEDLRDLAYDLEDLLDEFATEELERKLMADQTNMLANAGRALIFYVGMKSKMDDISKRLDEIWKENEQHGLTKKIAGGTSTSLQQRLPSTCLPTELGVYGRDEDTAKIIERVVNDESSDANFCVISIVGMAGIGKTTLARKVYNDEALSNFSRKAWVCVSDNFDVLRISKAILESITGSSCDLTDLNAIQIQLKQKLAGKKFFLVLDDLWNKNYDSWLTLSSPFMVGAPGSKVVVTTRHEDVALTFRRSAECCKLKLLSDDDCWSVFERHAFETEVTDAHNIMGSIRQKVVEKCKGLPLAAKILGGLLRSKQTNDEWLDLLNSKIWDLPDENEIPTALKLSYYHLPSRLKRCFAYCAVLPKNYEFKEEELVLLWIAEGLIQGSNKDTQLEVIGREYFRDLLMRSIFQQSVSSKSRYVMHDLVNDLAQWVSGDTCFNMEDAWEAEKLQSRMEKVRHFSYVRSEFDGTRKFQAFNDVEQVQRLRTFLPLSRIRGGSRVPYISHMVIFDLLSKFKKLRVLSLEGYQVTELPESLGHLRHLRSLNLSGTMIKRLPESTDLLFNLQILNLKGCSLLMKLPSKMKNLINLRYLNIRGTNLTEMPVGIKELQCLRDLSNFIVGKGIGADVKDLKDLKFLQGELCISSLENAFDLHEPREMILNDKNGLNILQLEWGSQFNDTRNEVVEKNVLEMLRPHWKLEKLIMKFYGGREFPCWLGNPIFSKMIVLRLENCEKCTSLPSLGMLASLKELTIKGLRGLKCIGSELYGEGCSMPFRSLESLHYEDLQEWENWKHYKENENVNPFPCLYKENENVNPFPCLRDLSIVNCPKLSGRLPRCLPSLEKLVVRNCEQLAVSFSNMSMVSELEVDGVKEMACDGAIDFKSLKAMSLSRISEFSNWLRQEFQLIEHLNLKNELIMHLFRLKPPLGLQSLTSLRRLCIEDCSTLVSFPEACLLYTLNELEIRNCGALTSLPEAVKHNNSRLEHLEIVGCDSLTFIVRGQLASSIKRLKVKNCTKLQRLFDDSTCLLEDLYVHNCPSLTELSLGGHLPVTLEDLSVECCSKIVTLSSSGQLPEMLCTLSIRSNPMLESIAESFHNNMHLESIWISSCENLKSLPGGLYNLRHLQQITIWNCPNFVCFPEGGLPNTNLRVAIDSCAKLKALPDQFHSLNSLQELTISKCPSIRSFPKEGFPTNLTFLEVEDLKIYKPLVEWGLHKLTSLTSLSITGCPDVESFPQKELGMMLPPYLSLLAIYDCPKLKCLWFEGFGNQTSLKYLWIHNCPNLASFPESGLPPSLLYLTVTNCPSLEEQCKKNIGKEWSKISHIPRVDIDDTYVYSLEDEE